MTSSLLSSGIPTLIDGADTIAHNKVMVIDDEIVITGFFNVSNAADKKNAENLTIIRNKELANSKTTGTGSCA